MISPDSGSSKIFNNGKCQYKRRQDFKILLIRTKTAGKCSRRRNECKRRNEYSQHLNSGKIFYNFLIHFILNISVFVTAHISGDQNVKLLALIEMSKMLHK